MPLPPLLGLGKVVELCAAVDLLVGPPFALLEAKDRGEEAVYPGLALVVGGDGTVGSRRRPNGRASLAVKLRGRWMRCLSRFKHRS